MDGGRRQLIVAILLGLVTPQVLFGLFYRLGRENAQAATEPTISPTVQTEPATQTEERAEKLYIPVVDGQDVKILELENYIRGVVLAEMPASFEMEALKAQAVAARTYTLRRMTDPNKHPQGAVCTDPGCCQAYLSDEGYLGGRGTKEDLQKIATAVHATAGEVLTYEGKLIEATYFSCSGGRTEDAVAVWGEEIPYLQAVDSPGEDGVEHYAQQVYLTASKFCDLLGRDLKGSPEDWLGKAQRTEGGGIHSMVIGGITYSGTQLRKLLNLRSTAIYMTADQEGITIKTLGWGHRVGMSQYGADAMAMDGKSYREILTHYYQGTKIDKLWDMG